MGRIILSFLFIILLTTCTNAIAKEDISDVKSTQGVELQKANAEKLVKIPKRSKEDRRKDKMLKSYNHKLTKMKHLTIQRERKNKNIEFLKHRLEVKEEKLEELTSIKSEKGERK